MDWRPRVRCPKCGWEGEPVRGADTGQFYVAPVPTQSSHRNCSWKDKGKTFTNYAGAGIHVYSCDRSSNVH